MVGGLAGDGWTSPHRSPVAVSMATGTLVGNSSALASASVAKAARPSWPGRCGPAARPAPGRCESLIAMGHSHTNPRAKLSVTDCSDVSDGHSQLLRTWRQEVRTLPVGPDWCARVPRRADTAGAHTPSRRGSRLGSPAAEDVYLLDLDQHLGSPTGQPTMTRPPSESATCTDGQLSVSLPPLP